MPLFTKVSGAWKSVALPSVRVGGAWKSLTRAWVRVGGAWKQCYIDTGPLSASLTTSNLSGGGVGNGPFNTAGVFVNVSGGVAPYTCLWEYVSGTTYPAIGPNDGNANSVYFIGTATAPATTSAVWRCKVTDHVGAVTYTGNVTVDFTFTAPLAVSLNTTSAANAGPVDADLFTGPVTGTPSGGTPGYTYAWFQTGGDSGPWATATTSAATAFGCYDSIAATYTSYWKLRVTDSLGVYVDSAEVTVTHEFF